MGSKGPIPYQLFNNIAMKKILTPFALLNRPVLVSMLVVQVVLGILLWHTGAGGLIPGPGKVLDAFLHQLGSAVLWEHMAVSMGLTIRAMAWSILITLAFAYLSVIPFFHGLAQFIVKCRYLTLTGMIFIFTLLTHDGGQLKLSLLIAGIVPFFVTSFLSVILHTDRRQYDLCQTLGYGPWKTLYEVMIVGKADQVLEILRQNFAISWLMITLVEGLSMSEGGIGTLLIKYNKYNDLTNVIALQVVIFLTGVLSDYLLGLKRQWLFPYTRLKKAK
jgi:sulfonate transport system permease protein